MISHSNIISPKEIETESIDKIRSEVRLWSRNWCFAVKHIIMSTVVTTDSGSQFSN